MEKYLMKIINERKRKANIILYWQPSPFDVQRQVRPLPNFLSLPNQFFCLMLPSLYSHLWLLCQHPHSQECEYIRHALRSPPNGERTEKMWENPTKNKWTYNLKKRTKHWMKPSDKSTVNSLKVSSLTKSHSKERHLPPGEMLDTKYTNEWWKRKGIKEREYKKRMWEKE